MSNLWIQNGDDELNEGCACGLPTLRPSLELEARLRLPRLDPDPGRAALPGWRSCWNPCWVMPSASASVRGFLNWGANFELARLICQRKLPGRELDPPLPMGIDGTVLHSLERLTTHFCEAAGYPLGYVSVKRRKIRAGG